MQSIFRFQSKHGNSLFIFETIITLLFFYCFKTVMLLTLVIIAALLFVPFGGLGAKLFQLPYFI